MRCPHDVIFVDPVIFSIHLLMGLYGVGRPLSISCSIRSISLSICLSAIRQLVWIWIITACLVVDPLRFKSRLDQLVWDCYSVLSLAEGLSLPSYVTNTGTYCIPGIFHPPWGPFNCGV